MVDIAQVWKMIKLALLLSDNKEISDRVKEVQRQYGFDRNRVVVANFKDVKRMIPFKMDNGKMVILDPEKDKIPKPDLVIVVNRICMLKHLREKKIRGWHPSLMRYVAVPFTPMDAVQHRHIRPISDDPKLFTEVVLAGTALSDIIDFIPAKELRDILGPCEHDP